MVDFTVFFDLHFILHYLHYIGVIIALGAVLSTDAVNSYLHLRPSIAAYDALIAPVFSAMVWLGLFILTVTGTLLFIQQPLIAYSTAFQIKMFFVAILFLNGLFINFWVTPEFQSLSENWEKDDTRSFEIIAGLSAAVSVISWLTVFTLGYMLANS